MKLFCVNLFRWTLLPPVGQFVSLQLFFFFYCLSAVQQICSNQPGKKRQKRNKYKYKNKMKNLIMFLIICCFEHDVYNCNWGLKSRLNGDIFTIKIQSNFSKQISLLLSDRNRQKKAFNFLSTTVKWRLSLAASWCLQQSLENNNNNNITVIHFFSFSDTQSAKILITQSQHKENSNKMKNLNYI